MSKVKMLKFLNLHICQIFKMPKWQMSMCDKWLIIYRCSVVLVKNYNNIIVTAGKNCHWTPLWSCHLLPLSGFLQVFCQYWHQNCHCFHHNRQFSDRHCHYNYDSFDHLYSPCRRIPQRKRPPRCKQVLAPHPHDIHRKIINSIISIIFRIIIIIQVLIIGESRY